MEVAEQAQVEGVTGPEDAVRHLVRLVEDHWVENARALAPEYAARWPGHEPLQRFARVLGPPRVLPGGDSRPRPSLEQERDWLKTHAHEYPGCWIGVSGDQLVAAAPRLRDVLEAMRATPGDAGSLFYPAFYFGGGGEERSDGVMK